MGRIFNALYDPLIAPLEWAGLSRLRKEVAIQAQGRTLEIGMGSGRNLRYYKDVSGLDGLDPAPDLLQKAGRRITACSFPVRLYLGRGEEMPFADQSFDSVVATLTLCTVSDPREVLKEIRRVLRPQGNLHLLEHVRWRGRKAWFQDRLAPLWKHLFGGCRINQDTRRLILDSPFHPVQETFYCGGLLVHWVVK